MLLFLILVIPASKVMSKPCFTGNNDNIEGYELVNGYDFPLYIDNKAIMYVIGTEMDYIKEEFGERFTFNNPNQTSECGCGESFHV